MAKVQVILMGLPVSTDHDTETYPVILEFGEDKTFEGAIWIIPSYPEQLPAEALSEIRVVEGELKVVIEGPEGFQGGPYAADWVRSFYPRGKSCSFLNRKDGKLSGVSVAVNEGSLSIEDYSVGGPTPT